MSIFLSRTPGYFCNPPKLPGEPAEADAVRLLSRHLKNGDVESMLERGTLRLVRGVESFPRSVRRGAMLAWPRPACVFVPEEGRIYADVACPVPDSLEPEFLICLGVLAQAQVPFVKTLLAKAARILDETKAGEKPTSRGALALIRYAFNGHVWKTQLKGVALLLQLMQEIDELVDKKYSQKVLALLRLGEKLTLSGRRIVALLPILAQSAAVKSPEELSEKGMGLYEEKMLEAAELPLGAICTVAHDPVPSARELFGDGADEGKCFSLCTERYPYPEQSERLLWEDWVPVIGNALAGHEAPESPLASLSIRPFARFDLMTNSDERRGPSIGLAATAAEDPLENERTSLHVLPSVRNLKKTAVEVLEAAVGESLDWAVLTLKAPDLHAGLIRAYCTSWVRQSQKLRTHRLYQAHLAFWACSAERVDENRHWMTKAPDFTDAHPKMRLRGRVLIIEKSGELCGREYCRVRLSQEKRRGGVFEAIVARDMLTEAGIRHDSVAELTGYFVAGEFTGVEAERSVSRLLSRKMVLKELPKQMRMLVKKLQIDLYDPKSVFSFLEPLVENKLAEGALGLLSAAMMIGDSRMANYCFAFQSFVRAKIDGSKEAYASSAACFAAALREGFDQVLVQPMVLSRDLFERYPADIRAYFVTALPLQYGDPSLIARNVARRGQGLDKLSAGDRVIAERLNTNMLLNSLNGGQWTSAWELARHYALGIGAEKDLERAKAVLDAAAEHGNIDSIFGVRALSRMGEKLFTLEPAKVLSECVHGIGEGNPASIFLSALFFLKYWDTSPDSYLRMAYALLKSLDGRIEPRLVARLQQKIREELEICTEEEERELESYDPWREIGVPKPDPRYPLYKAAGSSETVQDLNRVFLQALDSSYQGEMTARIRSQLEFFEPAATPAPGGILKGGFAPSESPLKQTELAGTAPEDGIASRLTFVYERSDSDQPWRLAEAYPVFAGGIELVFGLQGGIGSGDGSSMVLVCSYEGPRTEPVTLFVHDTHWPSLCGAYALGDRLRFAVYGMGQKIERLPEGSLRARDIFDTGRIRRLVEARPPQALFVTDSRVAGIRRCVSEVAGVDYSLLEILPFFDTGTRTFPVMIPDRMLPEGLKERDLVRVSLQLTGYALGAEGPDGSANA
jgi:TPR repeat protein